MSFRRPIPLQISAGCILRLPRSSYDSHAHVPCIASCLGTPNRPEFCKITRQSYGHPVVVLSTNVGVERGAVQVEVTFAIISSFRTMKLEDFESKKRSAQHAQDWRQFSPISIIFPDLDRSRLHYLLEDNQELVMTCFVQLPHRYILKARDFTNYETGENARAFSRRLDEFSYKTLINRIPDATADTYIATETIMLAHR